MGRRLDLHSILVSILGSANVYFQPPASLTMKYPCIRYGRTSGNPPKFAGNKPYLNRKRYQITVIDPNPDSNIPDEIAKLPMCTFDRSYTSDNLNHDVYNIYY